MGVLGQLVIKRDMERCSCNIANFRLIFDKLKVLVEFPRLLPRERK